MTNSQEKLDQRWDMHTDRQIAASKGAATAVTVLNSGSWLALLSQTGKLANYDITAPIAWWGSGALFGTLIWLFIYLGTLLQSFHDYDRENPRKRKILDYNIIFGVSVAMISLFCFAMGIVTLARAF